MFVSLLIKFCVTLLLHFMYADEWVMEYRFDYNIMVPETWHIFYPTCSSLRQSPINLDKSHAKTGNTTVTWFNWENKPNKIKLKNSGQTVMMVPFWNTKDAVPYIKVKYPFTTYIFTQLHFHWGPNDSVGSEHTLNGKRYPMEVHVVFYRKDFGTYAAARASLDTGALAAFTVFIETGKTNDAFQRMVVEHLEHITGWGMRTYIRPESLQNLVPKFTSDFFMYDGSLTTPPCSEIVTFFISTNILTVASSQLTEFRLLEDRNELLLTFNYRPIQDINDRKIYLIT